MSAASQTGFFISFEGSEGCGKSTQIRHLIESLRAAGHKPLLVREPGGTPIGEPIRHLLQHSPDNGAMTPEAELLLFAASRAQLVREKILPALADGQIVISDRFLDSTTVYQGVARKIAAATVETINRFAAGTCLPDVTFLLDLDCAEGLARLRRRAKPDDKRDRMEEEPLAFYEAVRLGYLAVAQAHPTRIRVLDAAKPQEEIARAIRDELQQRSHVLFQGICV